MLLLLKKWMGKGRSDQMKLKALLSLIQDY
jgi:hypothetical protein